MIMAVENEIVTVSVESRDQDSHPINEKYEHFKSSEQDSKKSPSVSIEPEVKKNIFFDNEVAPRLSHAKIKRDLTEKDESFEIQVEDDNNDDDNDNASGVQEEEGDDVPDTNVSQKQANTYAAKKTVAQGMMDIALITANANQLRYIIEFNSNSPTYFLTLILISVSLLLQVGVGVSLIFKGRMDLRGESKHQNAKRINNYVVVGIFLVTIINVFIASFTITGSKS